MAVVLSSVKESPNLKKHNKTTLFKYYFQSNHFVIFWSYFHQESYKVGIVSWGIGCGSSLVPGIYSSTQSGLCFIDWSTRCFHKNKYSKFFSYKNECGNWGEDQGFKYTKQVKNTQMKANFISRVEIGIKKPFTLN